MRKNKRTQYVKDPKCHYNKLEINRVELFLPNTPKTIRQHLPSVPKVRRAEEQRTRLEKNFSRKVASLSTGLKSEKLLDKSPKVSTRSKFFQLHP